MRSINTLARYWLPVCLLCAGIFIQSSFPAPDIGIDPLLWGWLPMDKLAHGLMYAALSALVCRAVFHALQRRAWRKLTMAAAGILAATAYGLSDEWHQAYVAARTADAWDLCADAVGAVLGAVLYLRLALGAGKTIRPS